MFITLYVKLYKLLEKLSAINVSLNTSTDTFVIKPTPTTDMSKGIFSPGLITSSCPGAVIFISDIISVNKLDDTLFAQLELSPTLKLIS